MDTKKRLYVGLLASSLLIIFLLLVLIWYLITKRNLLINHIIIIVLAAVALVIFIMLGTGLTALVIMILRSRTIPSLESLAQRVHEMLFPLALLIGGLVGINKEKILRSYIAVNNYLVSSRRLWLRGEQVMILLPHCLQNSECPHKITVDVKNCKACGKCSIGDLKKLAENYNASLKVATGGTLARKYISERKPLAVIAVACERDLSLGIQDMTVLPVIGVLNCRPHGPCIDTSVNIEEVEKALQSICKGG